MTDDDDLASVVIGNLEREIDRLRAELAAAKAEPIRPAVIIQVYGGSLHAFEDADDACKFEATTRIESGYARMRVQSWTWHPKSP